MPPKGTGSPYKNGTRYWGDFRSYADVGGAREPLIDDGESLATKDPARARELYDKRRDELQRKRRGGAASEKTMLPLTYLLTVYLPAVEQAKRVKRKLRADQPLKRKDRDAVKKTKHAITTCLTKPATINVASLRLLTTDSMTQLIKELLATPNADGVVPSPQTVRRHLMELSAMFERARFEKYMDANPLFKHPDIPPLDRGSALDPNGYLTRSEVRALLSEVVPSPKSPWAVEQAYTLFYTGCRLEELNGILVRDVDFDNHLIHILDYDHRNLKSKFARRAVPLWTKLAAVLDQSLERLPRPDNGLLFPRAGADETKPLEEQMMTRIRKSLKSAAARAKITKDIGHHIARHSYVSARLEMVEQGPMGNYVPVAPSTIVREVGHATDELIQTTYGHLTRKRTNDKRLDYGDDPVDFEARVDRGKKLMSEAVKKGLAEAKKRRAEEEALESERGALRIRVVDGGDATVGGHKKRKRPRGKGGRFMKAKGTEKE